MRKVECTRKFNIDAKERDSKKNHRDYSSLLFFLFKSKIILTHFFEVQKKKRQIEY
jgi:hypothetical protein